VIVAAALLSACTGSEAVDFDGGVGPPGAAGMSGAGAAGTGSPSTGAAGTGTPTGAAGASGGAGKGVAGAGAPAGAAGASGAAGKGAAGAGVAGGNGSGAAGHAGTSGSAGGGAAGKGAAGMGAAGMTGTGAAGATGAGGMQWTYAAGELGGIENVLIQNCGGCHFAAAGVTIQGGFSFSYANVTGVITSGNKACPNLDASKRRVVPGKPENSLLYIKISLDKPPAGCGGHMPYNNQRLTDNVMGWIRDWILQGAKP
jgi:hypothetical protein